jgi:hypothetical protein
MSEITSILGMNGRNGSKHFLVDGGLIFGEVSTAYAERVVTAMNRTHEPISGLDAIAELVKIIVEQNNMLVQAVDSRERDQFTGKQSDDSKRAMQLLARAGEIASKA